MTFTIEQLEALKEGTTPGLWAAVADYPYVSIVEAADEDGESTAIADIVSAKTEITPDQNLMAAAPALLDQLIATEMKLQKVLKSIEGLRTECLDVVLRSGSGHEEYTGNEAADRIADAHWEALTEILEENE